MSDLKNLLDDMLTDAGASVRAEEQELEQLRQQAFAAARAEREARERAEAEAEAKRAAAEAAIPKIEGVEELLRLSGADLQKVLAKLNPNDLLIVLSKGSEALQRRLLANLAKESVEWLRQNLEYLGDPNDLTTSLIEDSQKAAVVLTNKMLRAGAIELPEQKEEEEGAAVSAGVEAAEAAGAGGALEGDPLLSVLVELVAVAHKAGADALKEVVDDPGDPLLAVGLNEIASGASRQALATKLAETRARLLSDYQARLAAIEAAVLAMSASESPESFLERVKKSKA